MSDFIKALLGRSTCRHCRFRRMWGLYCGYRRDRRRDFTTDSAWQKYGCWHYVDNRAEK